MTLTSESFPQFFEELYEDDPFPWQSELAKRVCAGDWPDPIGVPTASGKTAAIDVAVFALAVGAPGAARRIFFVVDRRVVVDEATERAKSLAATLRKSLRKGENSRPTVHAVASALKTLAGPDAEEPLLVAALRGGIVRDDSWTRSPLQPTVCCSTVDQVGSSLLFRAYGARSPYNWPIRAGLAGNDSLVILDEAHLSQPFLQTAQAIAKRYRGWAETPVPGPFRVVEMSATATRPAALELTDDDRNHPVLQKRLEAPKPTLLVAVSEGDLVAEMANYVARKLRAGAKVVGVVCNRVGRARDVYEQIRDSTDADALLLTGRGRPWDRDVLWREWKGRIGAKRSAQPDRPIVVAATQCIEAGANLDFDALVTEVAALDALEQRFGRLRRMGVRQELGEEPVATVVAAKETVKKNAEDPIYGNAAAATWAWLLEQAEKRKRQVGKKRVSELVLDMGVDALRSRLPARDVRVRMLAPRKDAPILLPAHLDFFAQTSPEPSPSPEPSLFLHGPDSGPADVQVVWRSDLAPEHPQLWADLVATCPPSTLEAATVPLHAVRRWLSSLPSADIADVEGFPLEETTDHVAAEFRRKVLRWRGPDESDPVYADRIRPGDLIVAPSVYGGYDNGWSPSSTDPVGDIGDEVALVARGRAVLRNLPKELSKLADPEEVREVLASWVETGTASEQRLEAARVLAQDRRIRLIPHPGSTPEALRLAGLVGSKRRAASETDFYQESHQSSRTVEIGLDEHLDGVKCKTRDSASQLGLPDKVARTVERAAALHDIGKADPRFQAWLRNGLPAHGLKVLAKSSGAGQDRAAVRRARITAGYPQGGRHELQSVALITAAGGEFEQDIDHELLLHLVASHHGRCRPFAPVVADETAVEIAYSRNGFAAKAPARHELEHIGSGVSERYWRLSRRYGWWGLAYLETILRLADQRQSEEEQLGRD